MNKTDMVRLIQRAENNIPCFVTERAEYCNEHACLWRDDCLSMNNRRVYGNHEE